MENMKWEEEKRRREVGDLMGTSPGGEEVREVEFQGVRFGHNFLGIEVVEEFQFWQIIT